MSGLNLGGNLGVTYAAPPSYASPGMNDAGSLSSRAFGITTDNGGGSSDGKTAMIGTIGAGTLSALILVWIWHVLPR